VRGRNHLPCFDDADAAATGIAQLLGCQSASFAVTRLTYRPAVKLAARASALLLLGRSSPAVPASRLQQIFCLGAAMQAHTMHWFRNKHAQVWGVTVVQRARWHFALGEGGVKQYGALDGICRSVLGT
jgi:hypothetical protein